MLLLQEKIYLGSLYMLEGERAHFKLHLISDQNNSLLGYNSLLHDPAEIVFFVAVWILVSRGEFPLIPLKVGKS